MPFLLAAEHLKLHDLDVDTMDPPVSHTEQKCGRPKSARRHPSGWPSKKTGRADGWDVLGEKHRLLYAQPSGSAERPHSL